MAHMDEREEIVTPTKELLIIKNVKLGTSTKEFLGEKHLLLLVEVIKVGNKNETVLQLVADKAGAHHLAKYLQQWCVENPL